MKKLNVEKLFLTALGSREKLKWYLKNNSNIVNYIPPITVFSISIIPKDILKHMLKDFTMQRILNLLEKNQPELYKTINTPVGLGWMRDQIDNFRKRFLR